MPSSSCNFSMGWPLRGADICVQGSSEGWAPDFNKPGEQFHPIAHQQAGTSPLCPHSRSHQKVGLVEPWSGWTTEDSSCCWIVPNPSQQRSGFDPRAFWSVEARLVLFFIISCVVSIRKKIIYEVWMQNSQVWNSAYIWKARLTQGNNVTMFVTHGLGDLATEKNLRFIRVLLTWD